MPSLPENIAELIRRGRKVEAIKLLVEETGVDLKTAKEAVDKLDADPAFDPQSLDEAIANVSDEVKDLARSGNKIGAIKLLMDRTGVGLADAKEAVEHFLAGADNAGADNAGADNERASDLQDTGEISDAVKSLAWEGQVIHAIKLYREESGLGLKESKEVVDLLPRNPALPVPSAAPRVVALLIAALLVGLGAALAIFVAAGS